MEVDLSTNKLFKTEKILLDKKLNFIYGKNGSGKSSLTKLLLDEYNSDNIKVVAFQGFESIIGENDILNAIILGENNKKIEAQISEKNNMKMELKKQIGDLEETIDTNVKESKGFQKQSIDKSIRELNRNKEQFFTDVAREITNLYDKKLVENPRSYNKSSVITESSQAKVIPETEVGNLVDIIYAQESNRIDLISPDNFISPHDYIKDINELLGLCVEEKSAIVVESNKEREYLKKGLDLHKPGDKCKFCGNTVSEVRYTAIKNYFDADEVKAISSRLDCLKEQVKNYITKLRLIDLDFNNVDVSFKDKIQKNILLLKGEVSKALDGFRAIQDALEKKNPFQVVEPIYIDKVIVFDTLINKINIDIEGFNSLQENLQEEQNEAKRKLRLHHIAINLSDNEYLQITAKLTAATHESKVLENDINNIKSNIIKIEDDVFNIENEISKLISQTQSTERLVININEKLKDITNFSLVLQCNDDIEYYEVINRNGDIRPINQLSTGEKNLIAFLYFIESLETEENRQQSKIIVFDDPMNSNDDTVQYFILEELNKIMKKYNREGSSDIFVLLTHNLFFYQGLIHDIINSRNLEVNPYEKSNFYKLVKIEDIVDIYQINSKSDDFLNTYDGLWYELALLYSIDKPRMMLNPIRRIVETFIIFNGADDFYKNSRDSKRLFNVNSHGTIEFDVDIVGMSKDDLIDRMKRLFIDNNYETHFNKHWKYWKRHCISENQT
jgi:cation transport ATPase